MVPSPRAGALTLAMAAALASSCARLATDPGWRDEIARFRSHVTTNHAIAESLQPDSLHWTVRARLPAPYREASDLASTPNGLVITASVDALGADGAALFRWREGRSLETAMTWTGQGFLRVHAYGGRLVIPDADAPFSAWAFAFDWDVDGYVFVSDANGRVTENNREVIPRVYHVFDTARLSNGVLVASTGAYPSADVPYFSHHGPAALFVDAGPGRPWRRVVEYPSRNVEGVVRFTFMLPLEDGAILTGVQSSVDGLPAAVRIDGLPGSSRVQPVEGIAGETWRWAQFRDRVFHVGDLGGRTTLSRSRDGGRTFARIAAVLPQSLAASADALFLLDDGALWVSRDGETFERLAPPHAALRYRSSSLVSAPLVVHQGAVWAASPGTGEVLVADDGSTR